MTKKPWDLGVWRCEACGEVVQRSGERAEPPLDHVHGCDGATGESLVFDEGEPYPRRMESLPPVPLRDEQLASLLGTDSVVEVWVPDERPRSVSTAGGDIEHSGDILDFWIEFEGRYARLQYTSPDGVDGVDWYRFVPTSKDEDTVDVVEASLDDYRRLSDVVPEERP